MHNEAERELVREAAARVLAGQGLITIARDWNPSWRSGDDSVPLDGADATEGDEFYVRGAIGQRRYRSIRTRLEREVERLHTQVDHKSKQRIVLHPDPRRLWTEADGTNAGIA